MAKTGDKTLLTGDVGGAGVDGQVAQGRVIGETGSQQGLHGDLV